MKTHKVLASLFFGGLVLGLGAFAWVFFEGIVLGSSDPNIGAGAIMLLGFAIAIIFGIAWGIAAIISRSRT